MALTRVLITVKTYPVPSRKYDELVCTAGFREDGSWVRIYPVQFRTKPYDQQYKKYDWIEIDLERNGEDFRPESYRPRSHDTEIRIIDHIPPDGHSWEARRKVVLSKAPYTNLENLIQEAKDNNKCTSLAVFKPAKIVDFKIKEDEPEWDRSKLEKLNQLNLFEGDSGDKLKVVRKLPFKFSYRFMDEAGKESTLMIEDWEIGQLYWNSLHRHNGDRVKACEDVRNKYYDDFALTKDLHLFLGTTKQFHKISSNPFIIIGTFHPKSVSQLPLNL